MNEFTLTFSANLTVIQTVKPMEGFTKEQIIKGLQEGSYITTLNYNRKIGYWDFSADPKFVVVAEIVDQETCNSDYFDFEEESEE